jgi:hypothetical protein
MASLSNLSRWAVGSLAPAFVLAWVFSGCGKDSTIQISKQPVAPVPPAYRDATEYLTLDPTEPPKPNQKRIRVALKYSEPSTEFGGAVTLADGTSVLNEVKDKDIYILSGKDLILKSAPGRGWKVHHWEVFPGRTRNSSQTFHDNDISLLAVNEHQFVTLVLEPKKTVQFHLRTEGPDYHGGRHPYSGYIDWHVLALSEHTKKYEATKSGKCFSWGDRRTLETSRCYDMPITVPRHSKIQLKIRHRGKNYKEETQEIMLDDDTSMDIKFTEAD